MAAGDTNIWQGTTDNWATVTNWSQGAIPLDQEHVVCPDTTVQTMAQNVDRQGDTAGAGLDLRSFTTHPKFTPNLGTSGGPLKFTVDNTDDTKPGLLHQGSGTLFYNAETGTGGHATDSIIIDSPNRVMAAVIGGDVNIGTLVCRSGHTRLLSAYSGTISYLFVTFRANAATDSIVVLDTSSTAIATIMQNGGILDSNRAITTLFIYNGHAVQETQAISTVVLMGGTFVHNTTSTIGSVILAGGTYDTTQSADNKTITYLWRMPGARFLRSPQTTVTNEIPFNIPTL